VALSPLIRRDRVLVSVASEAPGGMMTMRDQWRNRAQGGQRGGWPPRI